MKNSANLISVIINTYNRGPYLDDCLKSLKRQRFKNFEVVVINGPSDDETDSILEKWGSAIKVRHIKERNLSISRNHGIDLSIGNIVAFIDDDAIAMPDWLYELDKTYTENKYEDGLGGCGGFVIDNTGRNFQACFQMCNRYGRNINRSISNEDLYAFPYSFWVPYNMGTNSSFIKEKLIQIGGFDEEYAWFYDESDVATRLLDNGYFLKTNPAATVIHRYAPSHLRSKERIPHTIYYPARSFAYFVLKNSAHIGDLETANRSINEFKNNNLNYYFNLFHDGRINKSHYERLIEELSTGIEAGVYDSTMPRKLGFYNNRFVRKIKKRDDFYRRYPVEYRPRNETVILVTTEFPPDGMGIANHMCEIATGLLSKGYDIRVIRPNNYHAIEWQNGILVHSILVEGNCTETNKLSTEYHTRLSELVELEIRAIEMASKVVSVISHVWDCPITTMLNDFRVLLCVQTSHTCIAKIELLESENFAERLSDQTRTLINAERHIFSNHLSKLVFNSLETVRSCNELFRLALDNDNAVNIVPHGIRESNIVKIYPKKSQTIKFLQIGRLELRKGIDTTFKAFDKLYKSGYKFMITFAGKDTKPLGGFDSHQEKYESIYPWVKTCVKFAGFIADSEMNEEYLNSDVLLSTSLYESFGLTIIEGMSRGMCVLASRTGVTDEAISSGTNGFSFVPGDANDLHNAIKNIYKLSLKDLRKVSRAGYLTYMKEYTDNLMIEKFAKLIGAKNVKRNKCN